MNDTKTSELLSSHAVKPFKLIPLDKPSIPICRVSTEFQSRRGNLQDQEDNIRRWLTHKGIKVLPAIHHVGKGNDIDWLAEAAERGITQDATLTAETICRYIRSQEFYDTGNIYAQLTEEEQERLRNILKGACLHSHLSECFTFGNTLRTNKTGIHSQAHSYAGSRFQEKEKTNHDGGSDTGYREWMHN